MANKKPVVITSQGGTGQLQSSDTLQLDILTVGTVVYVGASHELAADVDLTFDGTCLSSTSVNLATTASNTVGVLKQNGTAILQCYSAGEASNIFLGAGSGNYTLTGTRNMCSGYQTGPALTSGARNVLYGAYAGYSLTSGIQNTFMGTQSGFLVANGSNNVAIGYLALRNATNGSSNMCLGCQAGRDILGSNNTCIGLNTGMLATGTGNVFIGFQAGMYETESYTLLIDSSSDGHGNEATARTNSMFYGLFSSVVDSQYLRINAHVSINTGGTNTAWLYVGAGTSTSAPIRMVSGTLVSSALAGALEFNADDLYFTITTGTARQKVVLSAGLTGGRVPFATTNGRLTDSSSFTYDGSHLQSNGYKSSDGTVGATEDVAVAKVGGGTRTLHFKCGLYTGYTDS